MSFLNKIKTLASENKVKIKIAIGTGFQQTYVLVETNATKNYDYGYVLPVYENNNNKRVVLIPEDKTDYQMARYQSGNYSSSFLEDRGGIADHVSDVLYKRLLRTWSHQRHVSKGTAD